MRSFVALVLLSGVVLGFAPACGAGSAKSPAWPKMAEREEDGGESLAPRQPSAVAEVSDDVGEEAATPAAPTEAAAAKPTEEAKPDTTPTVGTPVVAPEEVINIDDIVIEIEE